MIYNSLGWCMLWSSPPPMSMPSSTSGRNVTPVTANSLFSGNFCLLSAFLSGFCLRASFLCVSHFFEAHLNASGATTQICRSGEHYIFTSEVHWKCIIQHMGIVEVYFGDLWGSSVVRALAVRPAILSSVPGGHMVEGENWFQHCSLTSHTCVDNHCVHTHM